MPSYPPARTVPTMADTCCARAVVLARTAAIPCVAMPSVTVGITGTPAAWIRAVTSARVVASSRATTDVADLAVNQNGLESVNRSRLATSTSVDDDAVQ